MSTTPPIEPNPSLAFFKAGLNQEIKFAQEAQETELEHAKNYAYTALLQYDVYPGEEYRQRERAATRRAFYHNGRADGHASRVQSLIQMKLEFEKIEVQILGQSLVQ